jgi:hypothetical protein
MVLLNDVRSSPRYLAIDRDSVGQGTCRSSSTIEGIFYQIAITVFVPNEPCTGGADLS